MVILIKTTFNMQVVFENYLQIYGLFLYFTKKNRKGVKIEFPQPNNTATFRQTYRAGNRAQLLQHLVEIPDRRGSQMWW